MYDFDFMNKKKVSQIQENQIQNYSLNALEVGKNLGSQSTAENSIQSVLCGETL